MSFLDTRDNATHVNGRDFASHAGLMKFHLPAENAKNVEAIEIIKKSITIEKLRVID